jgi:WD40 repeat protein
MPTHSEQGSTAPAHWSAPAANDLRGRWDCECGKTLRFEFYLAGKKARCPACGRSFTIPQLAPAAGAELTLRGHNGPIQSVAFSPDGRLLATTADIVSADAAKSELAETIVWDTESGLASAMLHWHRKPVATLAFSPDGRLLATGSKDHTISVWNVERGLWDAVMGVHERALRGHQAQVTAIAFSPDGQTLATAAADRTVRFWNTTSWQSTATIDTGRTGNGRLAFSPCGRYVAAVWTGRGPVTLWKTGTSEKHIELRLFSEDDTEDYGVGFSPDGTGVVVLGRNLVRIWDLTTCQVLASFEAPGSEALAVAPQANLIATAGLAPESKANVTLWDPATLLAMREFEGHTQSVAAIAFSSDGKMLATGGRDGVANLWLVG